MSDNIQTNTTGRLTPCLQKKIDKTTYYSIRTENEVWNRLPYHCVVKISRRCHRIAIEILPRACLNNHSRHLYPPLSAIFAPNSVNVARYDSLIWHKSPTKCGIHLSKSIFQTRSSAGTKQVSESDRYKLNYSFILKINDRRTSNNML